MLDESVLSVGKATRKKVFDDPIEKASRFKFVEKYEGRQQHMKVRKKIARLTLFHKAIQGESAIELPSYIKGCNRQLRAIHHNRFTELRPRTEAYRNSFYCRTIKEWNSLPNNVLDIEKT